jgi:hypothetical protein
VRQECRLRAFETKVLKEGEIANSLARLGETRNALKMLFFMLKFP